MMAELHFSASLSASSQRRVFLEVDESNVVHQLLQLTPSKTTNGLCTFVFVCAESADYQNIQSVK